MSEKLGFLSDRFSADLLDKVTLQTEELSDLTTEVLRALYDLSFNAHYAREALKSSSNELLANVDEVFERLSENTNNIIATARKDAKNYRITKRSKDKSSVFDFPELLYTEGMLKTIIFLIIEQHTGPFDISEEIVAYNTFEGYDHKRDYAKCPPQSPEEKEIVDGVEDLVNRFSFTNKFLTEEVYLGYIENCATFLELIFNYVVRELELCDALTPLGHVEYESKQGMVKLFLLNIQHKPTDKRTGFSAFMTYGIVPYKCCLTAKLPKTNLLSHLFRDCAIRTEIKGYELNDGYGASLIIQCSFYASGPIDTMNVLWCKDKAVDINNKDYMKLIDFQLDVDYATYLTLYMMKNYDHFVKCIASIALTQIAPVHSSKDELAVELFQILKNKVGDN